MYPLGAAFSEADQLVKVLGPLGDEWEMGKVHVPMICPRILSTAFQLWSFASSLVDAHLRNDASQNLL